MISFFVALSSFPKADTKVVQLLLPTKFFNDFFQEKFSLFIKMPINQRNNFSLFFELFSGFCFEKRRLRFLAQYILFIYRTIF